MAPEGCPKIDCVFYPRYCGEEHKHHRFWPRSAYEKLGDIAMKFREHPLNIDLIRPCEHRLLHLTQQPPEIPPQSHMESFLRANPL